MKGIYTGRTNLTDIEEFINIGITDVFMYMRLGTPGIKEYLAKLKSKGITIHWCIDCFSSGVTNERIDYIISKELPVLIDWGINNINLDAIRYKTPSIKNMKYRCRVIARFIKTIRMMYPTLKISTCNKAEWTLNYFTINFASKLYGQDYNIMKPDMFTPMAYANEYKGTWNLLNIKYDAFKTAKNIEKATGIKTIPIIWDDNYSYNTLPQGEWIIWTLKDKEYIC